MAMTLITSFYTRYEVPATKIIPNNVKYRPYRDNSDSEILRENDLIQLKFMRNSPFSERILGTFHH